MSASLVTTYRAMARNNAWANHRLLGACARLTQEEFEAPLRAAEFAALGWTEETVWGNEGGTPA